MFKSINFKHPRLTRDPRIWIQYLAWHISFWMRTHQPVLPDWIRGWALKRYGNERFSMKWRTWRLWVKSKAVDPRSNEFKPLPWPWCESAVGPFVGPWNYIERLACKIRGDRAHKCEFTDPIKGALYGGKEGAFMNRLFERFIDSLPDA